MLPFLKRKDDSSAFSMGEDEPTQRRGPDDEDDLEYGIVDAIAEDMLEAFNKKDKGLLKQALDALCDYIRDEDEKQDEMEE